MKILFITDLYPLKIGEKKTPLTLHNFVSNWVEQGHSVKVIKPNWIFNNFLRNKPFYPTGFYEYDGVKIFNVNYFTPFLFNISDKIPCEILSDSFDIVIAHMPSGIIFANKLAKITGAKLVCAVHCSDIEVLTNPIYNFYFKSQLLDAYKNATKIACRSFVLQNKFSKLLPEFAQKTFVAPSGISVFYFSHFDYGASLSSHSSRLRVLTCANLIKRKNVDKLILAINDSEDFKLEIIGDGKELKHLQKISAQNIKFSGRLPNEQVLDKMRQADIFVLPSVNETFGMVYLEAMACGCITVCTKDDGVAGVIEDSVNGFLTEPTLEGIKETLLRIKEFAHKDEIVEKAFETLKNYTQEACAKNYLNNIE